MSKQDTPIQIDYFSDVLCVWAYAAQARIDELSKNFDGQIQIRHHFVSIFGDTATRIDNDWGEKGGYEGFHKHLVEVCKQWDHVSIHDNVWMRDCPPSSMPAHLYLKGLQLWCRENNADDECETMVGQAAWHIRSAFFEHGRNVGSHEVLRDIAFENDLQWRKVNEYMVSGQAYAELYKDNVLNEQYKIPGSPALLMNEGRQLLYGNVGYHVMEANIKELQRTPTTGEASWC